MTIWEWDLFVIATTAGAFLPTVSVQFKHVFGCSEVQTPHSSTAAKFDGRLHDKRHTKS